MVKHELESALELSGQPVKRGTMAHKHIVYMMLAEAAAQLPDRDSLLRYAELLEEFAIRDDHQPYLAIANRSWGIFYKLNHEYAQAEERLKKALFLFEEQEAPWQIGRTLFEIAELAQTQADKEGAKNYYLQALTKFERLDAVPDIERTRARLKAFK